MNTHEVLVAARNLLDREGWCQIWTRGIFESGGNCASNAIENCKADAFDFSAQQALANAIGVEDAGDFLTQIFNWNDDLARTKDEVLAAFDKAISATAPLPQDLDLEVPVEQAA